jgi:hypothetical protein
MNKMCWAWNLTIANTKDSLLKMLLAWVNNLCPDKVCKQTRCQIIVHLVFGLDNSRNPPTQAIYGVS